SLTSSGSLSGSANGSGVLALSSGNLHNLSLNTTTIGNAIGTVSVNSTSQEAGSAQFSETVSTSVIAHAHPSFTSPVSTSSMTINFGTRAANSAALGLGTPTASFSVRNLADAAGTAYSSALDLDSIVGSGSTGPLSTNLATFNNLAGGGSNSYTANLSTSNYGSFS